MSDGVSTSSEDGRDDSKLSVVVTEILEANSRIELSKCQRVEYGWSPFGLESEKAGRVPGSSSQHSHLGPPTGHSRLGCEDVSQCEDSV